MSFIPEQLVCDRCKKRVRMRSETTRDWFVWANYASCPKCAIAVKKILEKEYKHD